MKILFNLLTAAAETTEEIITDATTTSNPLLDENGQFVDASQAVENVVSWWDKLDLVNKVVEKLPSLIIAAALVIFGFLLAKLVANITVKAMKAKGVDSSVYNFIRRIVSLLIKGIFIMSALSMFFNVSSFIAAIGAAGVTAGLGLQASVAQFASGIQILVNRPFKNGDFVEVNGIAGSVTDIRFMYTVVTTADNKRIVIPNSHITSNHIINYSTENRRRVDLIYSISYSDDITKAKAVIKGVAEAHGKIHKDPAPEVYVNSHEASSINLVLKVWCDNSDYWAVYYDMQEQIKLALDANGICIPFNQMDVHIVNND